MADLRLKKNTKNKISEFNLEELRGWIINQTCDIESKIDLIIIGYFEPNKKEEFKEIVLNSSIITTGAKFKILRNIPNFQANIISNLSELVTIRNYFAHLKIIETIKITIDGKTEAVQSIDADHLFQIMNSNGQLKLKSLRDLINDFFNLKSKVNRYLLEFNKVKNPAAS